MFNERKPIIAQHREPIKVSSSDTPLLGPPIFIGQETAEKRGVNTCVPTSIVNTAIGLKVISPEQAFAAYQKIMAELLAEKDMWHGANLTIVTLDDPRLAEITEKHLPITLGYDEPRLGKMILVPRSFQGILNDLSNRVAHVISSRRAAHAYASIESYPDRFFYIDPMQPSMYHQATAQNFARFFDADNNGLATATLVSPK